MIEKTGWKNLADQSNGVLQYWSFMESPNLFQNLGIVGSLGKKNTTIMHSCKLDSMNEKNECRILNVRRVPSALHSGLFILSTMVNHTDFDYSFFVSYSTILQSQSMPDCGDRDHLCLYSPTNTPQGLKRD